ncbi:hypothetical protein [Cohnella thailandensis]|uniref:Uncharacterized protein n=1 Tax=Cohnella thailandensis TaxID=557557 RepID=A0A841SS92_9BACL|nr:hypothetical protein [Cohnella thailandensis]MBB6632780.1 hypothetical protein [Cohnella thailandensis]MBP1975530.1 hypothetical protein [Cohnella thailandensis]
MKLSIEIKHSDGKDKLHLIDPTEAVQEFAVSAFFGYCREMNGEGTLVIQRERPKPDEKNTPRPEWYETGIKFKNGIPHYRTRYWCPNPNCNHSGNQYIGLHDKTTECHECYTVMEVNPATREVDENGIPKRDRFGNFFRAEKLAGVTVS